MKPRIGLLAVAALAWVSSGTTAHAQYNLYFGNFHAHCTFSSDAQGPNSGNPTQAFTYARDVAGIDVMAMTDHSHYLSTSEYSSLQSTTDAFTQNGVFVALAAQEHGNLSNTTTGAFGHMNVYEAFSVLNQSLYRTNLPGTYNWLTSNVDDTNGNPLVASFNHPFSTGGQGSWAQFEDLAYDANADNAMQFIEVLNGRRSSSYEDEYFEALAKGWHVGALGNQDNHEGSWGDQVNNAGNIPLTGIWSVALTKGDILDALAARRTFAQEVDPATDRISLKFTADGNWMGSEYSTAADSIFFSVEVSAPTPIASITLFRNGSFIQSTGVGATSFTWNVSDTPGPGDFYYLVRISQTDGDRAWTSPIWIESTSNFTQPLSAINADNPDGTPAMWFQNATVQGIVSVATDVLSTTENRFFIQDPTGGVGIFDFDAGSLNVAEGDNVRVTGLINFERGQTFIDPNIGGITIQGTGAMVPDPVSLLTNEVNTGEAFEGQMIELVDVSIVSGSWPAPGTEGTLQIDDGSGPCTLFIDRDTDVDDVGPPAETSFTVRGILTQDDVTSPHDCCYRIMPRASTDVFANIGVDVTELPSHTNFDRSRLHQNWPNPFRPSTNLRFELAGVEPQSVRLVIYDVRGKQVRELINSTMPPGSYEASWDGRSDLGGRVAAGVYYYRLVTPRSQETRKMVLLN